MYNKTSDCLFNSVNSNYMTKRPGALKNIQAFCAKMKFRKQTFYLALLYLDLIYNNKNSNYLNLEIACICCGLLAGNDLI